MPVVVYTFNMVNHQVLNLKYPSIKDYQSIYSQGLGKRTPLLGLIGLHFSKSVILAQRTLIYKVLI